MDRDELSRMLQRITDEATDVQHQLVSLQERLDALMTTGDGLRKLLGTTPSATSYPVSAEPPSTDAPDASASNGEKPTGGAAVRLILMSDPSRFWTVRDVWTEAKRRSWDFA
jgi:hypothetical protein